MEHSLITREEAVQIAKKLRRETRNPDVVALCEWVLLPSAISRRVGEISYRDYMREYMRKWREKKRKESLLD